jgi:hypothetical protein
MRHVLALISGSLLPAGAASAEPRYDTQTTRAMIAVTEMGRSTVGA